MTMQAPPGMFDIVPFSEKDKWRESYLWQLVEGIMRRTAHLFGFREIRTPLLEREELFSRSVGEATDIVNKEMYAFEDRGGRRLALRPEGTAAVMRAIIEHSLNHDSRCMKMFYIAPMFRYERAQAGRYRQHHQFGGEALGNGTPEQDVEVIDLLLTTFNNIGLQSLTLHINSLGDQHTRARYREKLVDYFRSYSADLSEDSRRRLDTNPLRILDSKDAKDKELIAEAPSILDVLNDNDKAHFAKVLSLLDTMNIAYQCNSRLVRGLDYYNGVVFEVTSPALGSQNSVGGGGRYDGLLHQLGGPQLPSIGFGAGLERIIQTLLAQSAKNLQTPVSDLYLIPMGDEARSWCFKTLHTLRCAGCAAEMDFSSRKIGKAMQTANSLGVRYTAVIGDSELEQGRCQLKKMDSGATVDVALDELVAFFQREAETSSTKA